MKRYAEAAKALQGAIKTQNRWGSFDFLDTSLGKPEAFDDVKFKNRVDTALEGQSVEDETTWVKFGKAARRIFSALSPFATNLLMIAKEGSNVSCFPVLSDDS